MRNTLNVIIVSLGWLTTFYNPSNVDDVKCDTVPD